MEKNQLVVHKNKSAVYKIVGKAIHKEGDTWNDVILYQSQDGPIYSRNVDNFEDTFHITNWFVKDKK